MTTTDLARRMRTRVRDRGTLRERVRALEAEVQENRQLNRRIAELTDVVAELLIPLDARDQARVDEVLDRFRSGL
ncbi:DUF6752 domain-containing protein [Nocardioides sp. LHD-245]|uniref:DUF6752 domain-containing protein n=1 Tax=Nocardioides sp. LHD-245 TaxID=3051387 RepID=UPI0027E0081B|nr:DUF6752 domain-containing protein [Nocardioides sp. LHD-245]